MNKKFQVALLTAFFVGSAASAGANHVQCSKDINNDGAADSADMKIILDAMGSRVGKAPYDERADLNEDGLVDSVDQSAYSHCSPAGGN